MPLSYNICSITLKKNRMNKQLVCLLFIGLFAVGLNAQTSFKCHIKDYPVAGELVYSNKSGDDDKRYYETYALLNNGEVTFTNINVMSASISIIEIQSIPIANIDWDFNNPFASNSNHKEKTENGTTYILVEYGVAYKAKGVATYLKDDCLGLPAKKYQGRKSISGRFSSKESFDAFSAKIIAALEK